MYKSILRLFKDFSSGYLYADFTFFITSLVTLVPTVLTKYPSSKNFPPPQFSFYLRMPQKYLFCIHTFYYSHYLTNRKFRMNTYKYMHMLNCYFYILQSRNLLHSIFHETILYRLPYIVTQYPFSILWNPNKMISCIVNRMTQSPYSCTNSYLSMCSGS